MTRRCFVGGAIASMGYISAQKVPRLRHRFSTAALPIYRTCASTLASVGNVDQSQTPPNVFHAVVVLNLHAIGTNPLLHVDI
jgi:hypothetical protein